MSSSSKLTRSYLPGEHSRFPLKADTHPAKTRLDALWVCACALAEAHEQAKAPTEQETKGWAREFAEGWLKFQHTHQEAQEAQLSPLDVLTAAQGDQERAKKARRLWTTRADLVNPPTANQPAEAEVWTEVLSHTLRRQGYFGETKKD